MRSEDGQLLPDPYEYLVKISALVVRVSRIFLMPAEEDTQSHFMQAQAALNEFHMTLPSELKFDTATFRSYAAINLGGAFVLLHVWFHV